MHPEKKMLFSNSVSEKSTALDRFSQLSLEEMEGAIEKAAAIARRTVASYAWRGTYDGDMPDGSEVQDVIQQVIAGLLDGTYTWPDEINFETFLIQTVRGLISNKVTGKENRTTSRIEQITDDPHSIATSNENTPDESAEEQESENLLLEIIRALDDRPDEQKIVEAILEGHLKRREIISYAGLSAKAYDNAKKRLERFLSSEEWQKKLLPHHK